MKHKILQLMVQLLLVFTACTMPAFAEDNIINVPAEGMVIVNKTYYGISKDWYEQVNTEDKVLKLALSIPSGVTSIANDALRDNYTYDKQKYGAITEYNDDKTYTDKYEIVSADFSSAVDLAFIGRQAAMYCEGLAGVLDLSATKVETIETNAFRGSGITGVILPDSLKNLGSKDGGSAFRECKNMAFVRTAGMDPNAVFQLPNGLLAIGKHSFYGCTGLPEGTTVTIPASVSYVGSEAFYNSDNITIINVLADDASGYDGTAFKAGGYGLGKRLTVFNNSAAKNTFSASGLTTYKNSITYEFTLIYKNGTDEIRQQKLYAQRLNVSKDANGVWFADNQYTMPDPGSSVTETGYDIGWELNGELLKNTTILKPAGDELVVNVKKVLSQPEIEVIVDGKSQGEYVEYPELNLTNDRPHTIGVNVTHPISSAADADVRVKFEYQWIDVCHGGSQGPRMSEAGFGRYNIWDKPNVKNTIEINGPEHERTWNRNYSETDYGDGYYLLIIYGYYAPKSGGQYKLFYQSANTVIGSDPYRTTDTAFVFDVITSDPASKPDVQVRDITVEHGYESAFLEAVVADQEGHTHTYQWYEAEREGQSQGGTKIEGATDRIYYLPRGKDIDSHHYYVEVTAIRNENGDRAMSAAGAKFTVLPASVVITPHKGQAKYFGQPDPEFTYDVSDSNVKITGKLSREVGEAVGEYKFTIGSLSADDKTLKLVLSDENIVFSVKEYTARAQFSPAVPNGDDGWYVTKIIAIPLREHSISTDGGKTWVSGRVSIGDFSGNFDYMLRSEKTDDTAGAIAVNTKRLKIDTASPSVTGVEDGKTYCIQARFQAVDANLKSVMVNGRSLAEDGGYYIISAGIHNIEVTDMAGNKIVINVTVNADHTFNWIVDKHPTGTENGSKHEECTVCGYKKASVAIPATGTSFGHNIPKTGDERDVSLWTLSLTISFLGIRVSGLYIIKKNK